MVGGGSNFSDNGMGGHFFSITILYSVDCHIKEDFLSIPGNLKHIANNGQNCHYKKYVTL